jgi:N-acetylglucosaminyltransferase
VSNKDYNWMARDRELPPWETETITDMPCAGDDTEPYGWADTSTMTAAPPARYTPTAAGIALKEKENDLATRRSDTSGLLRARARATRPRHRPVVTPDVAALTLTVVIPAHNEAAGLPETLSAIGRQTIVPERVIVVDDASTDGTAEIARAYGAEVIRRDQCLGSKSLVLNHALLDCDTDIILNVDGDTVIGDDFIERIKVPFTDPDVAVAAGTVQVWNPKGIIQRGRQAEYLLSFHLYRPLQNLWASPLVCSGAACAYRRDLLVANGGFPDGTIAEDMDYTWRMMLTGHRAVYVSGAECFAIDPKTSAQLRTQLWRWMSGYFQCLRTHWKEVIRRKKVLALLALLSVLDILSIPLWLAAPAVAVTMHASTSSLLLSLFGIDMLISLPVMFAGALKRKYSPWQALAGYPCIWVNRAFNTYYFAKAMIWELILVPCEWKSSLAFFEKGH